MENTKYSNSRINNLGYWLENPHSDYYYSAWFVSVDLQSVRRCDAVSNSIVIGVRPAIEVSKSNIEY